MKIQTLSLKNFTVFDRAEFEFSPGINVLIGANGTVLVANQGRA
ncbi:MAG: hypothetical protein ACKV0T_16260 [Planctomycetales bacterium]